LDYFVAMQSELTVSDRAPQLSVVIACRDAAELLPVQLAALARQESPVPWEVLVCDNGSTDDTVAVALSWAERLPLRVIDASSRVGAGPARNAGVEAARAEYIGFCDADDEVGDGWLAALHRALGEHPFVAGRFDLGRLNSPRAVRSRRLDQQTGLQMSSAAVGLPHAGGGNLGIHRSAFRSVGGFDPSVRYLQDTDLCWRVQRAGYPLVFVPELVVSVRLRSTLRGMYRQGRNYGACQALLERRHAPGADAIADAGVDAGGDAGGGVVDHAGQGASGHRAVLGAARLLRHFVVNRSTLGEQVWQLGWHVGHRFAGRDQLPSRPT
jgi:glycosyltransferase involved in cell wall biosynthesis